MLQAACDIVCAYLTGMRDCEVQALRTGCLDVKRSEDGLIERYQIRSTVYMGKRHRRWRTAARNQAPVTTAAEGH